MKERLNWGFYKKILDKINSNVYVTDVETDEIVYMNDYMKRNFKVNDAEGQVCWKVLQKNKEERCKNCPVTRLIDSEKGEICFGREKNDVTGRVYMNCDMIESCNDRLYHVRNSMDITDNIRLSAEASIDELTSVITRSAGKKRLSEMLKNSAHNKFTVALYDINGLKWVNDTYGHLEGDKLLVFTARNIQKELGKDDFIFRLSGDEFIVVFSGKDVKQAEEWMENMLRILEERKPLSGMNYDVSFSYGLACINGGEHLTVSDVLSIADTQMYIQKRDRHILLGQKRLLDDRMRADTPVTFDYNRDYVLEAISESADDYIFIADLKTRGFICSQKMSLEFGIPARIAANCAEIIAEKIHDEDKDVFLRSISEIKDGRAQHYTVTYRALNISGNWINLLCKGKTINDENGKPNFFAGVIRNLDKEYDLYASNMDLEQFISSAVYRDPEKSGEDTVVFVSDRNEEEHEEHDRAFYFIKNTAGSERLKTEVHLLNFVNRNIPGGIVAVYDKPEYPLFCINQTILNYTNYTYEEFMEITGGNFEKLIHREDREKTSVEIKKQLESSGVYEFKCRFMCKGGSAIWVYSRGKYVTANSGEKLIVAFFIDVTKETEQELELRFISQNSLDGIFKVKACKELTLIYGNDGFCKIYGYTKEQMKNEIGNNISSLIHPDDREAVIAKLRYAIENKQSHVVFEHKILKRDGSAAWAHVDAGFSTMIDGSEMITGMVIDITERRLLEEHLLRTERLFMIAKSHTGLGMWEYDIRKKRIILTKNSDNFHESDNCIENVPENFIKNGSIHPDSVNVCRRLYKQVEEGKDQVSAVIRTADRKNKDKYRWKKITYVVLKDCKDKPFWAIGVSEDITAQKEAENRFFKEEAMRRLLSENVLYTFRLNITKNILEEVMTCPKKTFKTDFGKVTYDMIFEKISDSIANADDLKRFCSNYNLEKIKEYAQNKYDVPDFEFRRKQSDGKILWVMLNFSILVSPDSGEVRLFGYAKNIDVQKKRELALQKKAEIDEVTGFYNMSTVKLLAEDILKNKRGNGINALMLLDVDDFKNVHLAGGLISGDSILKQMSKEIKNNIPDPCISARLNTDVFLLFFYGMNEDEISVYAQSVREALCKKYRIMDRDVTLNVSAGIAYDYNGEMSYDVLYRCAFQALDRAKTNGRNQLCSLRNSDSFDFSENIQNKNAFSEKNEQDYSWKLPALLEKGISCIENGGGSNSVDMTFLSYIAGIYSPDSIIYFENSGSDEKLSPALQWNGDKESCSIRCGDTLYIEQALKSFYPETSMYIGDENCSGYEQICRYYGVKSLSGGVILTAVFENSVPVRCLLLENVKKNMTMLKPVKTAANFMRHAENTQKLKESCEYYLNRDRKTGLYNYDCYMRYLKEANDDVYSTFGMVEVHIMDLKKLNRIYGNEYGDEILNFAAKQLMEIFGENSCYRISGARFIALHPDVTLEKFNSEYALLTDKIGESYPDMAVTAKVWEQHTIAVEKLRHQVDEKIEMAVEHNRKSGSEYDEKTLSLIAKKLECSIKGGGLCTFLQPKANGGTNEICGAEALVRYCTKDNLIIPPGRFLPEIEKAGLIRYVDLFVLKDVCRIMKNWLDNGWKPFTISVNYSRATILEPGILEETNRIVESSGVPKNFIEIEVTETIGSIDSQSLKDIVDKFVQEGYKIALDDFGAEYSNIYVLYSLQLNSLKLDRRIVCDIYHDYRAKLVVENLIHICKQLDIDCVAEGVETQELLDVLKEMSCDVIQGYYLNKPISEEDFSRLYVNC